MERPAWGEAGRSLALGCPIRGDDLGRSLKVRKMNVSNRCGVQNSDRVITESVFATSDFVTSDTSFRTARIVSAIMEVPSGEHQP